MAASKPWADDLPHTDDFNALISPRTRRKYLAFDLRRRGLSWKEIASHFGVSVGRAVEMAGVTSVGYAIRRERMFDQMVALFENYRARYDSYHHRQCHVRVLTSEPDPLRFVSIHAKVVCRSYLQSIVASSLTHTQKGNSHDPVGL